MRSLERAAAHRIVCGIVAAEIRRIRETDVPLAAKGDWPETTLIGPEGLGLDSLEQLGALGAVAETFQLDDTLLREHSPVTVGDWVDLALQEPSSGERRLAVKTSGSTGTPRLCVHALVDLLDEAAVFATRYSDRRRVVALVPAHHLYGIIWTALLPSALGVPVVVRTVGTALGLVAGDLVVAVPDQWRALLQLVRHFPEDVMGISSAGPLDTDLGTELLTAGLARITDVYGSSETSAIAARDLPDTAYALLPRWHLVAEGEADWQLADAAGSLADLPDHIERIGDRSLRPLRRRDGAVQVAGHNVWPARVAEALRNADGVADVAVRLHANGRLKAFIVPDEGCDAAALPPRLEQIIATLAEPERPKSLRYGTALPRNAMGKPADWV